MTPHAFRGNIPLRGRQATRSQADTRRPARGQDQHGRTWFIQIDKRSGGTVSVQPDFRAPWYPDIQYVLVNPENTSQVYIDYDALLASRQDAWEARHEQMLDWARRLHRSAMPPKYEYDEELLAAVGGRALKPMEPVVAAMQENSYILGFTPVVDKRLERFVKAPTARQQVLAKFDFRDTDASEEPDDVILSDEDRAVMAAGRAQRDASEHAEDPEGEDAFEAALGAVEEDADPEALGGRTVKPENVDRAKRQQPRGGNASAVRAKHGAARGGTYKELRQRQLAGRKTAADGVPMAAGELVVDD